MYWKYDESGNVVFPPKNADGIFNVDKNIEWLESHGYEDKPLPPPKLTVDDYDQAMEDYLTQVRSERGYTTREPSDYAGSTEPRWASDARDWIVFRDKVMNYGLGVINTYRETGYAPPLDEFLANMPVIHWTHDLKEQTEE